MTYRPVFRVVHLDDWCAGPANGNFAQLAADLAAVIGASGDCLPIERYFSEQAPRAAQANASPKIGQRYSGQRRGAAIDRRGVELPAMRVQRARRRELPDNQPPTESARLEANLERLLSELEHEVARLVGASHEALDSTRSA